MLGRLSHDRTTTTDKYMTVKSKYGKDGKLLQQTIKIDSAACRNMTNRDGSLNMVAVNTLQQNSTLGQDMVNTAILQQALKERMPNSELADMDTSFAAREIVRGDDGSFTIKQTNADGTIAPDLGSGSLWCTDPAATHALDNEYNGLTTGAGLNSKNALKFENTYWWNFDENTGYAVALKFSTAGAGEKLSLNFTNSQGNAGATSIHGPVYWQVEYSTDGTNFTVLPESGFCARPFVFWSATMTYCATPGYADRVFILPDARC